MAAILIGAILMWALVLVVRDAVRLARQGLAFVRQVQAYRAGTRAEARVLELEAEIARLRAGTGYR